MATVEDILGKYDEKVSSLAFQTRAFILERMKDIVEYPDRPANIIAYGFGPGYNAMICIIIPSKQGVKLGFYKGSELPDPKKLLTGSGKVHKHVEIKSREDFRNPALKKLMTDALKAYENRSREAKNK